MATKRGAHYHDHNEGVWIPDGVLNGVIPEVPKSATILLSRARARGASGFGVYP